MAVSGILQKLTQTQITKFILCSPAICPISAQPKKHKYLVNWKKNSTNIIFLITEAEAPLFYMFSHHHNKIMNWWWYQKKTKEWPVTPCLAFMLSYHKKIYTQQGLTAQFSLHSLHSKPTAAAAEHR